MKEERQAGFIVFLKKKNYSPSTIKSYLQHIKLFERWLIFTNLLIENILSKDIFALLHYFKSKGNCQFTLSHKLGVINLYFSFLMANQLYEKAVNPCHNISIKGLKKTVPKGILSEKELLEIYHNFLQSNPQQIRDKIVLGFLVFQGLNISNIIQLKIEAVQLDQGIIHIKESRKSNARELKLQALQIELLKEYIQEIRAIFIAKKQADSDYFIPHTCERKNMHNYFKSLSNKLTKAYPFYQNHHQLRASRIVLWLAKYNTRKVQYMAGHRFVSSTEYYQKHQTDDLQKQLQKYHPKQ